MIIFLLLILLVTPNLYSLPLDAVYISPAQNSKQRSDEFNKAQKDNELPQLLHRIGREIDQSVSRGFYAAEIDTLSYSSSTISLAIKILQNNGYICFIDQSSFDLIIKWK